MKQRFVSSNYNKHIIFLIPKVVGEGGIFGCDTVNRARRTRRTRRIAAGKQISAAATTTTTTAIKRGIANNKNSKYYFAYIFL
jgi:hypothetical protein